MEISFIFFNRARRLRSGWRLALFIPTFLVAAMLTTGFLRILLSLMVQEKAEVFLAGIGGWVVQAIALLISATLLGWGFGGLLEDLPLRALGWAIHKSWVRDFMLGTICGAVSLALAALIAMLAGGFQFSFTASAAMPAVIKTLWLSCLVFILAAAAEEALFRGYMLQTVLRSWPAWAAFVPSSILFASVHLDNPHVVPVFSFINTSLAGIWLAVAYLRTRSLWFPLGIHWSWNWAMGALLGLPVSGIEKITPNPLFHAVDFGPGWLTGGSYGIEGGAACTVALLISTVFIWRTRLLKAEPEMKMFTEGENRKGMKDEG